ADDDTSSFRKVVRDDLGDDAVADAGADAQRADVGALGDPEGDSIVRLGIGLAGGGLLSTALLGLGELVARLGYHLFGPGPPAQGGVGHFQNVRAIAHLELHVGRQVRQQLAAGVVAIDHDRVDHDVLRHG